MTCTCPSDCNCRNEWRTSVCGCLQHETPLWEMWQAVRPDPPRDSPLWPEARIREAYARLQEPSQLAIAPDASIVEESVQAPVPRHEAMALFTPAPTQLDGQLAF
jgi:hypothetical protein